MADWLAVRGMRCSVYAAQYLMEGLFEHGQADRALAGHLVPDELAQLAQLHLACLVEQRLRAQAVLPGELAVQRCGLGALPGDRQHRLGIADQPAGAKQVAGEQGGYDFAFVKFFETVFIHFHHVFHAGLIAQTVI